MKRIFILTAQKSLTKNYVEKFYSLFISIKNRETCCTARPWDRVKVQCGCCIGPEESLLLMCTKFAHLRESTDPKAAVKLLMNYNSTDKVGMAAPLEWGHLKEVAAKELYKTKMVVKHEDFTLLDCGLAVSEEHPFVGESPDGMQYCKCCGTKLVEVKAIYWKKEFKTICCSW